MGGGGGGGGGTEMICFSNMVSSQTVLSVQISRTKCSTLEINLKQFSHLCQTASSTGLLRRICATYD